MMNRRLTVLARLAALGIALCVALACARATPNIVFIIADDLGWADVAFHKGNAPTPHLDKLAREGVELTQHYTAATCSPTRVGLLTGRFWSRFGILASYNLRALPYAASIMHLDDAVGRILAALQNAGKRENTLVVFTSDNGGSWSPNHTQAYPPDGYPEGKLPGSNIPLRGQKGDLYEGGIRVPTIVSWPGKLTRGKVRQPMHIVDWMPTFCAIAGYKGGKDLKWDGVNVWPSFNGAVATHPARVLYWTTPGHRAVRDGDWKLIVQTGRNATAGQAALFDLSKDPNEKSDLAARMPGKVDALKRKLAAVGKADRDAMQRE